MSEQHTPPPSEWGDDDSAIPYSEDDLRKRQNLPLGIVGGVLGALLGAAIWAGLTAALGVQIGYVAIGVGFLAGLGVRILGKGYQMHFGILGALLGIFGCVIGNIAAAVAIYTGANEMAFFPAFLNVILSPRDALGVLQDMSGPMDILFYGLAGYFGSKTAFQDPYA